MWKDEVETLVSQIMGLLMLARPFLLPPALDEAEEETGLRSRLMGTLPHIVSRFFCSLNLVRYRSPQALHSVPLPSGPARHSGVESVPQCSHRFHSLPPPAVSTLLRLYRGALSFHLTTCAAVDVAMLLWSRELLPGRSHHCCSCSPRFRLGLQGAQAARVGDNEGDDESEGDGPYLIAGSSGARAGWGQGTVKAHGCA